MHVNDAFNWCARYDECTFGKNDSILILGWKYSKSVHCFEYTGEYVLLFLCLNRLEKEFEQWF